jgi:hypothetical protein
MSKWRLVAQRLPQCQKGFYRGIKKSEKLYPDLRQQIFVEKASETALRSNLRTNPEKMTLRSAV